MIAEDLDRVWSNCVDYPEGGCRDFDRFWQYVLDHQIETQAFYAAITDQSLITRLSLKEFKHNFDVFLSQQASLLDADTTPSGDPFLAAFKKFILENQSYL